MRRARAGPHADRHDHEYGNVAVKAIVQDRYGAPDVLRLREIERPAAGPGEVLVRVRAAAVNAHDWHIMRGDPYFIRLTAGLTRPRSRIRGRDFAGEVESVGAGVATPRPGDEVFGEADGTFAEYVRVPANQLAPKPANLTFEQAAAVPLAANTALLGVRDLGRVRPGQAILINGAAGGVGTFAVQIAKALGAEVTAVCGARNADLVRSIGADHVVDYTRTDFTTGTQRYDLVLDLVANRSLAHCRRALTPRGTLVLSGGGGGRWLGPVGLIVRALAVSPFVRHSLRPLAATPRRESLLALTELIEAGRITPVIDRTYPLADAPTAIRYVEGRHARAKVVITVAGPA